jgi:predicted 3-demethylubiquinone-9 3-methyltransferase (glyoxalase superfamily)
MQICLWFDDQAEEAAKFYCSVFKDSKMGEVTRYEVDTPSHKPKGSVMTVEFEANGMNFMGLNGGPLFKFNEAVSIVVNCDSQEEVDYHWNALIADGGKEGPCGWLTDKFGLSWQVVPEEMNKLMTGDSPGAKAAMKAMLGMKKLDLAALQKAYEEA